MPLVANVTLQIRPTLCFLLRSIQVQTPQNQAESDS